MGSSPPAGIVGLRADPCPVVDQGARTRRRRDAAGGCGPGPRSRGVPHRVRLRAAVQGPPGRATGAGGCALPLPVDEALRPAVAHPAASPDRRRPVRHRPQPLTPAGSGRQDRRASHCRGEKRPKLVTTEHNAWDTFAAPTRWANRLTAGLDDAVYAVSDETKRSMRGRAAERCVTLQHGIDVAETAALATEREAVRKELGIGTDELVIGTVANYREQKDYPNLLRAAAELDERGVPARIVAVGQGQLEADIVALRDELGLQERVMLTGHRPDAATRDGGVRRVHAGLEVRGPPRRPDGGARARPARRGHTGGRHRRDADRRRSRAGTS